MIVTDASTVIVALTVDDRRGDAARETLAGSAPLHGPHVLDLEVLSGIRGLLLGGKVDARRADQARQDLRDTWLTRHAHHQFAERIWELRHNLTPYDATYVALAETLGCSLLTADSAFLDIPGLRCDIAHLDADLGAGTARCCAGSGR